MTEKTSKKMIVYGHDYCIQSITLARALKKHDVDHEWRDIMTGSPEWQEELKSLARGNLSVPTVVFPDGNVWVEPFANDVLKKAGIERISAFKRLQNRLQR